MFCEKCGKKISKESVFCEFCGNEIINESGAVEISTVNKEDIADTKTNAEIERVILNEELKQIANHLAFLGYEADKLDAEGEKEFVAAKHSNKNNILFWDMLPNFILFRVTLTTEKKPTAKMADYVNKANKEMLVSRFHYVIEDEVLLLRFEAVYIGKYVKETFGQFQELFEADQNKGCSLEDFSKLFIA